MMDIHNDQSNDWQGNMMSVSPEWQYSQEPVPYEEALAKMEARVNGIIDGTEDELIWVLEHPSMYTAGTSANKSDLIDPDRFPIYKAGRGGQYTYHGPGILIAYVMLDLKKRQMQDIKKYVFSLEQWIIDTLAHFNIKGERRCERVGIWVPKTAELDEKIAAIGIRVRRWVTFHGVAINICPDLRHFEGIIPCGIQNHGVTSMHELGKVVTNYDVYSILRKTADKMLYKKTDKA